MTLKNFKTGFLFAVDVDEDPESASGYKPAERHYGTGPWPSHLGKKLYGDLRIQGALAALQMGFIERLVLPGKNEKRFGPDKRVMIDGEMSLLWQGWAIREMLIKDHGVSSDQLIWIPSTGTTSDAASVMKRFFNENPDLFPDGQAAFITNHYHVDRAGEDLRTAGLYPNIFAAERFIIAAAETEVERQRRKMHIFGVLSEPGYVARIIDELQGGASKVLGVYDSTPFKQGWDKPAR